MKKTMKTTVLALLLSLGFLSASAAGAPKTGSAVGAKIKQTLSIPEELKNPGFSQEVKVSFKLNAKGGVEQVIASTGNQLLKSKIEKQLSQIAFPELQAGVYNVVINFNVY
jgi:hypothetical protein